MNSGVPSTLVAACVFFISVARPRSPIFTSPWLPLMKMLSHFRSRWMMGGSWPCRKMMPFSNCHAQFLTDFKTASFFIMRWLSRYERRLPLVNSSVMKLMLFSSRLNQLPYIVIICLQPCSPLSISTSAKSRSRASWSSALSVRGILFHATSMPSSLSKPR